VLDFSELSEGEQQLLTVFGLLFFTQGEDALILLDEPDTHINPVWGWQYFEMLDQMGQQAKNSHLVMITHDPLVVSSLLAEQVRVLQARTVNSRTEVTAVQPSTNPQGSGIAGILTGELFGLKAALDKPTTDLLNRARELEIMQDRTPEQELELQEKQGRLDDMRFGTISDINVRDPMYAAYLRAMYASGAYESIREKTNLSTEDQKSINETALEIVRRLRAERRGES
jgi:energy-coupling factor transporter ATP-binding protein EcfA2